MTDYLITSVRDYGAKPAVQVVSTDAVVGLAQSLATQAGQKGTLRAGALLERVKALLADPIGVRRLNFLDADKGEELTIEYLGDL